MLRRNFPRRKDTRRTRAAILAEHRASRTTAEQLARLDAGGYVARRERTRLMKEAAC